MKNRLVLSIILIYCSIETSFGQKSDFTFKREIQSVNSKGWYEIKLPNNVISLTHADFEDIRIYRFENSDTIEVPYLLRIKQDLVTETLIDIKPFNQSTKNGTLYFTFKMPEESLANFIKLSFFETNFDGLVGIEGSNDQKEWFIVVDKRRILQLREEYGATENVNLTSFNFPISAYRFLRLKLQSNDSSIKSDFAFEFFKASFKRKELTPGNIIKYPMHSTNSKVDSKKKQTLVEAELSNRTLLNRITLDIPTDEDYQRRFLLETLSDSVKSEKGWILYYKEIAAGFISSMDSNSISFPYQKVKKLRLTIDNLDSPPLTIKTITAFGPEVVLLTKLDEGDNFLFYGNDAISNPVYDLKFFEKNIPLNLAIVTLGDAQPITKEISFQNALFERQLWLWIVMAVIIALLGFFTMRMMKKV